MANRSWHVNFGVIVYILTIIVLVVLEVFDFKYPRDASWLLVAFLMAVFGAQFPDLDQLWKKIFGHRDWLLHSAIVPLLMVIFAVIGSTENAILYPIIAIFCLGVGSHLLLDYFPTWEGDKDKKLDLQDIVYATEWVFDGITGGEHVQKMVGTFLIHFPKWVKKLGFKRNTLTKEQTRLYLTINGLTLLGLAIFLFARYIAITH